VQRKERDQKDVTDALNAIYAEESVRLDEVVQRLQFASLAESPDSMPWYRCVDIEANGINRRWFALGIVSVADSKKLDGG